MAKVSVQLDANTVKLVEMAAAKNHTSVTGWIKDRIQWSLKQEWPKVYFSLPGSPDEEDIFEHPEIPFSYIPGRDEL